MRILSVLASTAMTVLMVGSCQKKDDFNKEDLKTGFSFCARSGENAGSTKTLRKENGDLWWSPEDEIKVFIDTVSGKFVSQNDESAEVATFEGAFEVPVSSEDVEYNGVMAFYPYSEAVTLKDDAVIFSLPSAQTAVAGTFDDDLYPAVAKSSNTELSFYNICGGAKFTVSRGGIKTVTFRGNNSEPLAGKLSVAFDGNGVPAVEVMDGETDIVVTAPDGGTFEVDKEYYIVTIPQSLTNGFTLIYNDGLSINNEFKTDKAITIRRSKFGVLKYLDEDLGMRNLSDPIRFKDSVVEKICVANWDTDGDGRLSYAEAAAVKTIGTVFRSNTSITSFYEFQYFTGVTSIGSEAFRKCSSLTSVTIPKGVTSIGGSAFNGCSSLGSVAIPEGVTSIGPDAFRGCNELYFLIVPSSVTSIGESAFYECNNIAIVQIPDVASWCEVEIENASANPLRNARQCKFNGVVNPKDLVIPEGVTSIGTWAFLGCNWLKSVTIPSSVTSIGGSAFHGCSSLESVTISEGVTSIGEDAFLYCDSLSALFVSDVPSWFEIDFKNANSNPLFYEQCLFNGAPKPADFVIPEGTTSIGTYAFHGCNWLKSVTIPSSVTTIDSNAFSSCNGLESVTFSEGIASITSIDSYAFSDCAGLTDLIISGSVKSIGNYSFSGCTSLKNITILEGVRMIGDYAFSGCNATQAVTVPQSVVAIGAEAFLNCTGKLTVNCDIPSANFNSGSFRRSDFSEVEIGEGVTKIGNNAFNQSAVKTVTISNTVTSIGSEAFWGCDMITDLIIPDSVTSIGVSAFEGCSSLTSVVLSESITSISDKLFSGCSLTDITIPNSVTEIGKSAFYLCDITSVTIPENVTLIHGYAFGWCENLKTVFIKAETRPAISKNAFDPIPDGFIIYVPYSSLDSYLDSWGVFSAYLRGYAF